MTMPRRQSEIDLTVARSGSGRPVVVVHGGGGPSSVAPIVAHLSGSYDVLAPTIPGFDGTQRPGWFTTVDDVALAVLDHLRDQGLFDVTVIGSSVGGWVASAMAVFDGDGVRVARLALLDGVGVEIPGQPIRDFFALDPREVSEYTFHDSERFYVDPSGLTDAQQAVQLGNLAALRLYAGEPYMHDPHLIHRLARIGTPVLGVWGDSDRIATPDYGRAYLAAFPHSDFEVVADAGHLPHLEQPEATFALLDPFLAP